MFLAPHPGLPPQGGKGIKPSFHAPGEGVSDKKDVSRIEMANFIRKSLHSKILLLVVGLLSAGVVISIFWELRVRERELLEEKLRASAFIAQPILNAIYEDMLEERADMARHLVASLGKVEGIELHIIRSNGTEEAFRDLKTVREVEKEFGEIRPEWISNHPDEPVNRGKGVGTEEFKKALEAFKQDWKRKAEYYIDRSGPAPVFTYLQPIEKKQKCSACHAAEGARGILMIVTPLDDVYTVLSAARSQWIITGLFAMAGGGVLLSLLIKKSITGPIKKSVEVIKRIAADKRHITERVQVTSDDEIGYLTRAFNDMLDTLEERDRENKRLFELVAKSKEEWEATFDAIQDLISIHDLDYKILKVNTALAEKINARPEEIVGRKCHEIFYCKSGAHDICPHAMTMKSGKAETTEVDDWGIAGSYKVTTFPIFNEAGAIYASVHVARDITHEKMLREQLLHAEKLSSVGKLVAGIAHELNNPLMGIMGFSQILMDMPGDKKVEDIKEKLRKIYHESITSRPATSPSLQSSTPASPGPWLTSIRCSRSSST
ncbi:MAG: PAS domain-containing protein [Deltaproteobacteria bacterium]|nr:PAS domain-containing protein [Deltaproteobacteria bacterium]